MSERKKVCYAGNEWKQPRVLHFAKQVKQFPVLASLLILLDTLVLICFQPVEFRHVTTLSAPITSRDDFGHLLQGEKTI